MYSQTPPGFPASQTVRDVISAEIPTLPERQPPAGLAEWRDYKLSAAKLSPKERECAVLMLKGLATKEMAEALGNTEKTLKHHIASIFKKFGVGSRAELFHEIFPT